MTGLKVTKVKGSAAAKVHQGHGENISFASKSVLYLQEMAHSYIKVWDIVGVCLNLFDSLGRKQFVATSSCDKLYLDPTLPPESLLRKKWSCEKGDGFLFKSITFPSFSNTRTGHPG